MNFEGFFQYDPSKRKDHIKLYDAAGRPLVIELEQEETEGGARKVLCYAGVWLVNKAGQPLSFRRRIGGAGHVAQHRKVGEVDFELMRRQASLGGLAAGGTGRGPCRSPPPHPPRRAAPGARPAPPHPRAQREQLGSLAKLGEAWRVLASSPQLDPKMIPR